MGVTLYMQVRVVGPPPQARRPRPLARRPSVGEVTRQVLGRIHAVVLFSQGSLQK